jgi:hypothetical protein
MVLFEPTRASSTNPSPSTNFSMLALEGTMASAAGSSLSISSDLAHPWVRAKCAPSRGRATLLAQLLLFCSGFLLIVQKDITILTDKFRDIPALLEVENSLGG